MRRGDAKFLQGGQMLGRRITGVAVPAITRMLLRQIHHEAIACHFCHNGGGGDGKATGIALDDAFGAALQGQGDFVAVDQVVMGQQGGGGALHGQKRGVQDVQLVNLLDAGMGDGDGRGLQDQVGQGLAPGGGEFLAVAQAGGDAGGIQDHGGGGDRAAQGAAANFVNARHAGQATGMGGGFELKIGCGHGGTKAQAVCRAKGECAKVHEARAT